MPIDLGESESSQKQSNKSSKRLFTNPSEEIGLDAPAWTPALVQQYLDETYDVEYSIPSCRRLLKKRD
jgi:transposase